MRRFVQIVTTIIIIFFILLRIIKLITPETTSPIHDFEASNCLQYSEKEKVSQHIQRSWQDLSYANYCIDYSIDHKTRKNSRYMYQELYQPQTNWSLANDAKYYGEIYWSLYQQDRDKLKFMADSLYTLGITNNLNNRQLAEMIVTFVQDIPYVYVFDDYPCDKRDDKSIPCSSGNKFGLKTPVEFLYTLIGDCDTRSVLLYLLLKELEYDVAIVVSYEYLHAMIAINLPYSGDYIRLNNNRYYFWETTATNWKPGLLPPDCSNVNYWKIAIY